MTQVTLESFGEVLSPSPTELDEQHSAPSRLTGLSRRFSALRATPHLVTWIGVGVTTIGMVLLVVAWGKVAGLTNVGLQMPYLVSAGFTGVALVLVGLTIVNIDAKRADAAARTAQIVELRGLLSELHHEVANVVAGETR